MVTLALALGTMAAAPFTTVRAASAQTAAAPATPASGEQTRAPQLEYLGTLRAETGSRTVIENGPQGTRTIVQLVSGRFEGPRLKASLQAPAADWVSNRADGTVKLDVRFTLRTDDGAVILVTYNGIGQPTEAGLSLRSAPLFETGDSRYAWLTRLQAVGVGQRVGTSISYDIYVMR
jgi:hypothetical protein